MKDFKKMFSALLTVFMLLCILPSSASTAESDIPIDETHFPDVNFGNSVLTRSNSKTGVKIDTDSSGSLSPEKINAVTNINARCKYILDFTGIGYFNALTYIDCFNNQLMQLNVSNNTKLRELEYRSNRLTSFDLNANAVLDLYGLTCNNNKCQGSPNLSELTTLPIKFETIKASGRQVDIKESNIITLNPSEAEAVCFYDCGRGHYTVFIILPPIPVVTASGDYDCSGIVNVQDAILTLRAAMELITPSEQSFINADMDENELLTVTDAIAVLRVAMGLI